MEELLRRHITETDRRFEELCETLGHLHSKVDELREFRTTTISSSRWVSLIVSAICGLVTMVVTTVLSYKSLKQ